MSTTLILFLLAALLIVCLRQLQLKRVIRDILTASEKERPYLETRSGSWLQSTGIRQLAGVYNALLEQSQKNNVNEIRHLKQIEITLNNLAEAVITINRNHQLILVNPSARTIFSIPAPHQTRTIEQYIRSPIFLEMLERIKQGQPQDFQEISLQNGATSRHFEATGALIAQSDTGKNDLILFVFHEITRMKQLENLRKEFVANVSHELRTPLTVIKGFTEALVDGHDTIDVKKRATFLHKIQKNVDRLHLLLEDLLKLSRLERGKEELNLEPVQLSTLITEAVEDVKNRIDTDSQSIIVEHQLTEDTVIADPIKLSQVLDNILDNALRYAKGFTKIKISAHQTVAATYIKICDDGCGIPEKDLKHIFKRFYRVDKGRSRELGGTGLGLSIVKHIVQLHGGSIRASSQPGKGTCIEIELPLNLEHP